MTLLILGLLLFLGVHSVRIVANDWRAAQIARIGEKGWKGLYALLSVLGLVLISFGFGQMRGEPVLVWTPPHWTRHVMMLFTLPIFVFLVAGYVPGNHIKSAVGQPVALSAVFWSVAHLMATGRLGDVLLFGSFLLWSVVAFRTAQSRDRAAGAVYPKGRIGSDVLTLLIGLVAWAVFAGFLHVRLIGVSPFG